MTTEKCRNCGQELTDENVALAKEDAGVVNGDELVFFCPGYNDEYGCRSYQQADRTEAAYWATN